jgi:phytoene dehydrogenase-like protein
VKKVDCIIIGAGLSGLACARTLVEQSKSVLILESTDSPGGRVGTDTVNGFQIDRGFQVYLDSYAEGKKFLDYPSLNFGAFEPGALVAHRGRLLPISDPWRRPYAAIRSVLSGVVGVPDGLRVAYLRNQALAGVRNGKIDPIGISNDQEKNNERNSFQGASHPSLFNCFSNHFSVASFLKEI